MVDRTTTTPNQTQHIVRWLYIDCEGIQYHGSVAHIQWFEHVIVRSSEHNDSRWRTSLLCHRAPLCRFGHLLRRDGETNINFENQTIDDAAIRMIKLLR